MRSKAAWGALGLLCFVSVSAAQDKLPISGAVFEVGDDYGGVVSAYDGRVRDLRAHPRRVAFSGVCGSACTLLLSLPPEQLCVAEAASFKFHAPSASSPSAVQATEAYLMSKYPAWVRSWIATQGGLTATVLTMDASYTRKFLRACN